MLLARPLTAVTTASATTSIELPSGVGRNVQFRKDLYFTASGYTLPASPSYDQTRGSNVEENDSMRYDGGDANYRFEGLLKKLEWVLYPLRNRIRHSQRVALHPQRAQD